MIKLSSINLDALEKLDGGSFGTLYKKNDIIYKIYNPKIFVKKLWKEFDNPCYNARAYRYKKLLRRCEGLKKTDVVYDYIADEYGVKGVVLRYFDGKTLDKIFELPLNKRIMISKEILDKDKELKRHLIYVDDYKEENILYTKDGEPQIIDIDDAKTHVCHVPNPLLTIYSNYSLGQTIASLLGEFERYPTSLKAELSVTRKKMFCSVTHAQIHSYINSIEKKKDILYIDKDTDVDRIKEVNSNYDFKLVYLMDSRGTSDEDFAVLVKDIKKKDLILYDFLYRKDIDNYDHIESINEAFTIKDKDLVRVYKK